MKIFFKLILPFLVSGNFVLANTEGSLSVITIPININQETLVNLTVEVKTVNEKQIVKINTAQLVAIIQKLGKEIPKELIQIKTVFVSLDELTNLGFYSKYDDVKVQININLPLDKNNPNLLSIGPQQEAIVEGEKAKSETYSGYLNTSLTAGFRRDQQSNTYGDPLASRFDSVLNLNGYVIEATGSFQNGNLFERDDFRITKEVDKFNGLRISAGDLFYPVLGYQSYRKMGGVSAYTTRLEKQGMLSSRSSDKQIEIKYPSTLTFFVNDQAVATRKVSPGFYDISDIPLAVGVNRVRVLVEAEGSGQREEISFNDFVSDYGIKKGQQDFAIALGLKSVDLNSERSYLNEYQTLMINHRYDPSNEYSLSQYVQADKYAQLVGSIEAVHVIGGYVQLDSAVSNWMGVKGVASRIGYYKTKTDEFCIIDGDRYSVNAERKFSQFSSFETGPASSQTSLNLAYTLPLIKKSSIGFGGSYGKIDETNDAFYSFSGTVSRGFGNFYVNLNASQRYSQLSPAEYAFGLSLNWSPNERSFYMNSQQTGAGQNSTHLAMNTSRDQDVKGSITETSDVHSSTTQTQITGITNRNEMTVSGDRSESRSDRSYVEHFAFNTRFSLAFAGSKFAIGRPISDSFFMTDTHHEDKEYKIESWGKYSTTGAMGEALVGFQNYGSSSVRVQSGDPYGSNFESVGSYHVDKGWKSGYLLKIKRKISPTIVTLIPKEEDELKNSIIKMKNIETGFVSDFFVSSSNEIFLEGIESGVYEFSVGKYVGRFLLDGKGGRKELDLDN
jgi:hypothetical protein